MNSEVPTLVFAAGGTGGHLFPAIAVAEEIRRRRPDAVITFIGARGKIEERVVPAHGFPFTGIRISGLQRRFSLTTALFPLILAGALCRAFLLLRKLRPRVVVGTGGYVCAPVVIMAQVLGIPTLVQEQNSVPGITTRLLARRATEVHLTFEGSRRYFHRQENLHVSGNPTRAVLGSATRSEGAAFFGLDPARKTVLLFGGSQGAESLNAAMLSLAPALAGEGIQIVWQTGMHDFERIRNAMRPVERVVRVFAFIDRMEMAYATADLAVCRAGASTIAELTRLGIPAVYVPFPFAAADHQTENARAAAEAGAAILVADRETAGQLPSAIRWLLGDTGRLTAMAEAARGLGRPGATGALAEAVMRYARGGTDD